MKRFLLICCVLSALFAAPVQAKPDVGKLLGGLIQAVAEEETDDGTAADAPPAPSAASLQQSLAAELRLSAAGFVESCKEGGRAYAKELGDVLVQRFRNDPEIKSTLDSIRNLCWGVIAYLTLVTLIGLVCLVRIMRAGARMAAAIEELKRSK